MARTPLTAREVRRRAKRREEVIEGIGGLGLVIGLLLTIQRAMDVATAAACTSVTEDTWSRCLTHELLAGAKAIAPAVLACGALGLAIGVLITRLVYGRSAR